MACRYAWGRAGGAKVRHVNHAENNKKIRVSGLEAQILVATGHSDEMFMISAYAMKFYPELTDFGHSLSDPVGA